MISRLFLSALVLAVVAALAPPRAESCSIFISYGPVEERERLNNSAQAPDFQFRYWHDDRGPFGMELTDAEGRSIPSRIVSSEIPYPHFYPMAQAYSVLVPARPLRPGRYTFRVGQRLLSTELEWRPFFTIGVRRGQPASPAPEPPTGLTAAVAERQCKVNTRADCTAIMARCVFLDVAFSAPDAEDEPVIEVSWAPVLDGRPDVSRKRAASGMLPLEVRAGRRTLSIPGWWFEGLQPTDAALWFELKRVNRTGRRSAAVAVTVPNAALLATARRWGGPAFTGLGTSAPGAPARREPWIAPSRPVQCRGRGSSLGEPPPGPGRAGPWP